MFNCPDLPAGPRAYSRHMERVWDYPRPPALVPCERRVRVEHNGETVAESTAALRVLETSHPPTIYIPPGDVRMDLLTPSSGRTTVCEWKGRAHYYDLADVRAVAWAYADPRPAFTALRDHIAFYPSRVDACYLDDERVQAQAGDFYGGWITADIEGPFKGGPGTAGW
jgi:uncharacterized protein (DUF427 family)